MPIVKDDTGIAKPFGSNSAGIRVESPPNGLSRDKKLQMIEYLKTKGRTGVSQFQEVANAMSSEVEGYSKLTDQAALEESTPETTAKGLLSSFVQEAGPMAAITGAGLLAAGGTGATVLGLGAKGANWLNEVLGFEPGDGIADPIAAGRAFLEKIGLDEDPDTVWERIAQGAGVGVDEAITMILTGNVLSGASPLLKNIPKIGEKVSGAVNWVGNLLKSKPGTQIAGGLGGGGGTQGGAEYAEYAELGPVMSVVSTVAGGVLGDLTTTQVANIAGKVQDLARATSKSVPEAAQIVIDKAKSEGLDIVLSDIKPLDYAADLKRNVREVIPGGTGNVRHNVQTPQRRNIVERIASEYDIDINDPNVDRHLSATADEFFKKRDADLTGFTNLRDEAMSAASELGSPEVPTQRTADLIDQAIADLVEGGDKDMQPLINKLANWKEMITGKNLTRIEEHRGTIGKAFTNTELAPLKNDRNAATVNDIYRSLREDIGEYIKESAGDMEFKKYEDAMSGLSELSKDFDNNVLSTLMKNRDTPTKTIENIIMNGKPEEILELYKKLPPAGQSSARAAMIAKFIEDATSGSQLTARGMEANISPNTIAAKIKDFSGQHGVIFSAEDSEHLSSIGKILESTSRAEKDALIKSILPGEDLPGGKYMLARLIAKNPAIGIPAALSYGPFTGFVANFMERPMMRDLMLKYDDLPTRARSGFQGTELLKRMGEVVRGYIEADESEESEAAVGRISTQLGIGE